MNRKDLGILVGLLLTDGCVSGRYVLFHNKSDIMHNLFREKISKLFGEMHIHESMQENGVKISSISNRKLVDELKQKTKMEIFRRKQFLDGTFPEVRIPKFMKHLSSEALQEILQVIFTADGSVSLSARWHKGNKNWEVRRRIELSCKHPKLRKDFFDLIEMVDFLPRTSGENITLERKSDIIKFSNYVRFVPGVKVGGDSKYWKGFEKNQVLDAAVKTFALKKKDLEHFKMKSEVMDFLILQSTPIMVS